MGRCVLLLVLVVGCSKPTEEDRASKAAIDRGQRQAPIAIVAPAPAPAAGALPLVEDRVDRAALRRLLRDKRYAELEAAFETFQSRFEADPLLESLPIDAGDAFASPEPTLTAELDAWIAASPSSFAPYLARGAHIAALAQARRGGKFVDQTAREDFAAEREAQTRAAADLVNALKLRPNLVAADLLLVLIARGDARKIYDVAIKRCPRCLRLRATYIGSRTPRWGGSYDEMLALAAAATSDIDPRFRVLPGYVDLDRANLLEIKGDNAGALAAIDKACALGDHAPFLVERARIHRALSQFDAAQQDVDRAWAAQPGSLPVLARKADVAFYRKDYEAAGQALLAVLRVDPADVDARDLHADIVQGVVYQGWEAHKAGHDDVALRLLDLALDLAPTDNDAHNRRSNIIYSSAPTVTATNLPDLIAKAKASPDELRAFQSLDYALAKQRRFADVVALWDDYLARHPDDGRAHLERAGALHHLGRAADATTAATKACDLGVSEGCLYASR